MILMAASVEADTQSRACCCPHPSQPAPYEGALPSSGGGVGQASLPSPSPALTAFRLVSLTSDFGGLGPFPSSVVPVNTIQFLASPSQGHNVGEKS